MTLPVVSVFIPTHDRPHFLREAIESVLDNGFGDIELVVSDDSESGSGQSVVESINDPRIRYLRNPPPSSMAGNWDYAVRATRGRYAFKLDDDDRILPGFLSQCVAILEHEPDVACVYTGHRILREWMPGAETVIDTKFFGTRFRAAGLAYLSGVLANEGGYPRNQKTAGVFRRAAAERLDFYRFTSEDFAFSAALGFFGQVAYIPEALYEWRVHRNSGARNLPQVWKQSDGACTGLLNLPPGVVPESFAEQWKSLVTTTRRALPLFYLRAAFIEGGIAEGWKFWGKMRQRGSAAWQPLVLLCLVGATVTPGFVRRGLFDWYQRSPLLQRLAATLLRVRVAS